jgi:hypothetical protein
VFGVIRQAALEYHVLAALLGQCPSAFFAVWGVHHDTDGAVFPARSIRAPLKARLSYAMFYRVKHHWFPTVPTRRWPILAARLDRVAPELAAHKVF